MIKVGARKDYDGLISSLNWRISLRSFGISECMAQEPPMYQKTDIGRYSDLVVGTMGYIYLRPGHVSTSILNQSLHFRNQQTRSRMSKVISLNIGCVGGESDIGANQVVLSVGQLSW